jgi:ribosome maturation factor RimP
MNNGVQIQALEQMINGIIGQSPGVFLVELKMLPGNNIKVFIDGDSGVPIDKLVQYNRSLYKKIEESGTFPDSDFSLEVSSPGLDEPLKRHRQYVKNIGRSVEVLMKDGIRKEGKLIAVDENEIVLEEEKGTGKKKEIIPHTLSLENIKTTKVQIKF